MDCIADFDGFALINCIVKLVGNWTIATVIAIMGYGISFSVGASIARNVITTAAALVFNAVFGYGNGTTDMIASR